MTIKALLWDMDGTLINSEPLYETALHNVNHKYQLEINTDIDTTGVSMPDLWDLIVCKSAEKPSYQTWAGAINQHIAVHMSKLRIFDQALNVLQKAHQLNLRQACVSNNTRRFIEQIIMSNEINHMLDHWLGCEDFDNCKPHPEPYLQSAQKLGLQPQDCLAIEDSAVGVASAKAAGLKVALFCPPHQLLPTQQADYIVKCHSELISLLN